MFDVERDLQQPDLTTGTPAEVWGKFFAEHRPAPQLVGDWVKKLHEQKQYPQVIACLQAAMLNGQAQPWMYEVLALNLEIEKQPKEAIERVVLSLTDFGDVDFSSMMYSGAYLTRFGRQTAALTMYRQASRLLPERPEPYVLGLRLAQQSGTPDDIAWAANGVLLHYWKPDFIEKHKAAELALLDLIQKFRREQQSEQADRLEAAFKESKSCDLSIRLAWNGDADVDMRIEEPGGAVCSLESPETQGGGLFLHDGVGPAGDNTYELYMCPRGVAGPYRVRVRNAGGKLVGNRATLTVTIREGLADQSRFVRALVIDGEEVALTVDLPVGRRTAPRIISEWNAKQELPPLQPARRLSAAAARAQAAQREQARQQLMESRGGNTRAGAVGYAPVIDVISEGTGLSAQAVISPDRRYVRLGLQPVFNDITDVFTFTYLNGR